jgi:NAD+ kinase
LTYSADSMIVATPTGSTAYNLSAHGPVVSPGARAVVVTPVAAHMLFDRSLVLAQGEDVTMEVIDGRQANLIVDGQDLGYLSSGDLLRCRAGQRDALLVSFGKRHFHQILKQKFNLPDR